jgi:glucokinase
MIIAGDIGGTKTELGTFSRESGPNFPLAQKLVHSADYYSLQAIVTEFLEKEKILVAGACFAVAGPVICRSVKTTNLPWLIEENSLAEALKLNPHSLQ